MIARQLFSYLCLELLFTSFFRTKLEIYEKIKRLITYSSFTYSFQISTNIPSGWWNNQAIK